MYMLDGHFRSTYIYMPYRPIYRHKRTSKRAFETGVVRIPYKAIAYPMNY